MKKKSDPEAEKSAFEVLDIPPDASGEEIEEAYLLLVATYGDTSFAPYSVLTRGERKAVLEEVERAYRTLSSGPTKGSAAAEEKIAVQPSSAAREKPKTAFRQWLARTLKFFRQQGLSSAKSARPDPAARTRLVDDYRLSAGQYLKQVRSLRGLSLEAIADSTKISVQHLLALEENRYEELPSGSYRRLMLAAYARCLDLSPKRLLKDLPEF